jgi:CHAD domain-containing protein
MTRLKISEPKRSERVQQALARAARDPRARIGAGAVAVAGAAGAAVAAGKIASDEGERDHGPSRAYRLKRKEAPASGALRIAYGRIDDAIDRIEDHDADPAASVHEARKDLKKLRSLLRLLRPGLSDEIYRRENARFRELGHSLSGARDAEVKLETLAALSRASRDLDGLGDYTAALEGERDRAGAAAADVAGAITELTAARDAVAGWAPDRDWKPAGRGLVRQYRRGRRALAAVRAHPSDEAVHEWRKRSKDLWYHLRILNRAWADALGPLVDEAHELSDLLGDHHDLAVLAADASARPGRFTDGDLPRLEATIRGRQEELLDAALPLGERLYAERPKAFGRRFATYWSLRKR